MDEGRKRERMERFEAVCRRRGWSLTAQRRIVLEAVLDRTDHPTADQVHEQVRATMPRISRMTVYRVLDWLAGAGVIRKANSPGAATRFDPVTHRHHHLVCVRCNALIDIEDERLDHQVRWPDVRSLSFEIEDFSIHFHGVCAACREEKGSTSEASIAGRPRAPKREAR